MKRVDLLGVPASKVNEDRIYRSLDELLPHKEGLERHLKNRLGELFDLDYDLLLYDVTRRRAEAERAGSAGLFAQSPSEGTLQ